MSGALVVGLVECSYCPGGLGLLASRPKSEQACHCAGDGENPIHPPANVPEKASARSSARCPSGVKGSHEESFC